jgi:hypothetical protein
MNILAHGAGGYGANSVLTPWELHPILIHFPIAFLLGGVLLSLYAGWRGQLRLEQVATGLLLAGLGTLGWVATAVFLVGSALGGYMVYHGGAGIDAMLLKPGLHEEDHHASGDHEHSHAPAPDPSDQDKANRP